MVGARTQPDRQDSGTAPFQGRSAEEFVQVNDRHRRTRTGSGASAQAIAHLEPLLKNPGRARVAARATITGHFAVQNFDLANGFARKGRAYFDAAESI